MEESTNCKYCGFEYRSIFSSQAILHLCSDQEEHFCHRLDLTEEPLKDLEEDIPDYKPRERINYKIIR